MSEIDFNTLIKNYEMCKKCNRQTSGIDDFKNAKGKLLKTCNKCRKSVQNCVDKKRGLTNKEQICLLKDILKLCDITTILNEKDNTLTEKEKIYLNNI